MALEPRGGAEKGSLLDGDVTCALVKGIVGVTGEGVRDVVDEYEPGEER